MKLYLTTAYPFHPKDNFAARWLGESAKCSKSDRFEVVSNPESADVILFVEHHPPSDPYFFEVLKNKLYKKYPQKVIVYQDNDKPLPLLPTISPSIEKFYHRENFTVSGPYIARHCENTAIEYVENKPDKKYLFSFIGAVRTHEVRDSIMELNGHNCFLKDTSDKNAWELSPEEKFKYEKQYVEVCLESEFVLCPRGYGVNSYRLYEMMEMGIAPVIISDEWIPMKGPAWEEFSIRIKESDVSRIPEILQAKRKDARIMGKKARANWEQYYTKDVAFKVIAEMCESLYPYLSKNNSYKTVAYMQFLRPFHFRNLMRYLKNNISLNKTPNLIKVDN